MVSRRLSQTAVWAVKNEPVKSYLWLPIKYVKSYFSFINVLNWLLSLSAAVK